jgi:hypothetical protein
MQGSGSPFISYAQQISFGNELASRHPDPAFGVIGTVLYCIQYPDGRRDAAHGQVSGCQL